MRKLICTVNVIFCFITFKSWSQPLVQVNDTDWTSSTVNGACNCSNDFNNG